MDNDLSHENIRRIETLERRVDALERIRNVESDQSEEGEDQEAVEA